MGPRLLLAVMTTFFAAAEARAESFKSWAARGAREEREKDPKAAFSSYSNALSMWDEDDGSGAKAKVLCARAGLREKQGDDPGAVEDLSACLALDKKNVKGFHRRGVLLLKQGKTPAAIGDFYKAVALDIHFAQAYADRARAYESQGEAGFAREDYRQACSLGVKAACAKAKAPAPKAVPKKGKEKPEPEEAPAETTEEAPTPKKKAAPSAYRQKFKDCRDLLAACVERGNSFGGCVEDAPNCDAKAVKGCCPAACLKAYQKSINGERSEAQAFREHFSAESACGIAPKETEDD
ncbi:MAG: hypothetical protein Q7J64_01280 [Elusimicrobiota bacterium]|nr:hypothetical protein [Elusimicrobiota bacterium]